MNQEVRNLLRMRRGARRSLSKISQLRPLNKPNCITRISYKEIRNFRAGVTTKLKVFILVHTRKQLESPPRLEKERTCSFPTQLVSKNVLHSV